MDLVTIFKGWNLTDAELVRARLEAAGFHPILQNEFTANVFGGSPNTIAPIRVEVPKDEADDAREFLEPQ